MFSHLLITRFNLKNQDWLLTKNKEQLLDNEWMQERMELFENYCFPSVVAQTNKNFSWLLFFDSSTEELFKKQIIKMTQQHDFIKVMFIDGMPSFNESILSYIKKNHIEKPYLITSRIDNDDCISCFFIEEIQNKFASQDFMAFDFIEGYSLQISPNVILGKKEHIFNPFISLIEKNKDPKTVWHYKHNQWKKEAKVTQVTGKRVWMSVIHEKNKVNEFDGYGKVNWEVLQKEFILSEKTTAMIHAKSLSFRTWWFKSFKNFVYVKMVLLSKKIKKYIGIYKIK